MHGVHTVIAVRVAAHVPVFVPLDFGILLSLYITHVHGNGSVGAVLDLLTCITIA